MILNNQIITNIQISSVKDLYKLKPFMEDSTLKINKSQIARELAIARRTVDKYIHGYQKTKTRNSVDCIASYYDIIRELLSDRNQSPSSEDKPHTSVWGAASSFRLSVPFPLALPRISSV